MKRRNGRGAKAGQEDGCRKTGTMDQQSSPVAMLPTQEEDIRARWGWVEPSVWTDRMLATLENGVKGGKWYSLCDKVWSPANLQAAWDRVYANRGGSGIDGQTVHQYGARWRDELACLHVLLKDDRYVPQPVRRVYIPKPGKPQEKRPLGIPAVRDRVVQTALRHVVEPIFERIFAAHSYGFRPGRGCKDALRRVDSLLKAGYTWVVDADLKGYFDTIPHEHLMTLVEEHIADGRILALLRAYLRQKVMDGLAEWTPETGTPQGAVISPLLANLYLNPLDHLMAETGYEMVRYADDFVILCQTREEAERALAEITVWVTEAALTLHPEKTRIVQEAEGFDFLGYHFTAGRHWPRSKSARKFQDGIRDLTGRTNGHSLEAIVARLNPKLRGWYGYFKHSYKTTFPYMDGWIRRRLRAILNKRKGRSRWQFTHNDHKRWPNAFFHALGLFSLAEAHAAECRSLRIR
jgi:RNA-directed DNA polymerase